MLRLGITTVECKSGYGLDVNGELKQLEVYRQLSAQHCITLVATFLGAHVVPGEFQDNRSAYVQLLCENLIPTISIKLARFAIFSLKKVHSVSQKPGRSLAPRNSMGWG
jgi:imidazolonepropionase